MEKYIVIIITIILLYYVQKYCIQSEVNNFLITKNVIENFADNLNNNDDIDDINSINLLANIVKDLSNNGLKISNNIIINDNHKLSSDGELLRLTDISNQSNNVGISIDELLVDTQLTVGTDITKKLSIGPINGTPRIYSQGNIIIGSDANKISLKGNIDISSNLTVDNTNIKGNFMVGNINKKPILLKVITGNTQLNEINTGVSHLEYPCIVFSGYNLPPIQSQINQYITSTQFNTIKRNNNWYISFQPNIGLSLISIRLTFYHKVLVEDETNTTPATKVPPTITT